MVPKMLPRIFSRHLNELSIIKALKEFNCVDDYEDKSKISSTYTGGAQGSALGK